MDGWKREQDLEMFRTGCRQLGITLTDHMVDQFLIFYQLMDDRNKVMNLTAITDFREVLMKHYLDSLLIVRHADLHGADSLLDLGTGAGFPGIPLKIVFPDLQVMLADSLQKRVGFLNDVIRECGLKKIDTVHARAEDLGHDRHFREKYGLVVSRAVANLSTLSEYCLPLVRVGGSFVSYKSVSVEDEFRKAKGAISVLGGESRGPEADRIPESDLQRSFIVVHKKKNTPAKYPRKAGMPGKEPL